MIAFDADILTEILAGNAALIAKAACIPAVEQAVPVIVVEEVLRGRLHAIHQAETGNWKLTLSRAYELLDETISAFHGLKSLAYVPAADDLYREWRANKIKGGTPTCESRLSALSIPLRLFLAIVVILSRCPD